MKIELAKEIIVEKPYAILTITASEYDTIRNALNWAQSIAMIDQSRSSFISRLEKLYQEMAHAKL